jgi:hypothetical protein
MPPKPQRRRRYRAAAIRLELAGAPAARLRDFHEGGMAFDTSHPFAVGERLRGVLVRGAHRVEVEGTVCWLERRPDPAKPGEGGPYRVGVEFPSGLAGPVRRGLNVLLAGTGFWRPQ